MRIKIRLPLLVFIWLTLPGCSGKIQENSTPKAEVQEPLVRGGIMVYETDGHGLIVAPSDLARHDWTNAVKACDDLEMNGYDDWRLPTKEELDTLYTLLKLNNKGGFDNSSYWSSSEYNSYYAWRKNFKTGKVDRRGNKEREQGVRAIRDF